MPDYVLELCVSTTMYAYYVMLFKARYSTFIVETWRYIPHSHLLYFLMHHSYYDAIQMLPRLDRQEVDSYFSQASRIAEIPAATYSNVKDNVSTNSCVLATHHGHACTRQYLTLALESGVHAMYTTVVQVYRWFIQQI